MLDVNDLLVLDANVFPDENKQTLLLNSSVISIINSSDLRKKWDGLISPELSSSQLTKMINQLAKKIRFEFESALEDLAANKSIFWRATRTAEKNTLINPLFENTIIVNLILQHDYKRSTVVLITDNSVLLAFFQNKNILEKIKSWPLGSIKSCLRNIKLIYFFVVWFVGNVIVASRIPYKETEILIHTFVDEDSRSSHKYRERYFPGLVDWYTKNNLSTSHLVSGAGNYPLSLFKTMNSQGSNVFNEFKLYKFKDLIFVVNTVLKLRKTKFTSFVIGGTELKELVGLNHSKYGIDLDVYKHILRAKFGERLSRRPNPPKVLLTEFEGMIPEKMLNLGISRSSSGIKTFGFQHGAMFEHLLCNYPTEVELQLGLISEKIISNGSFFKDLMISRGLPRDRIVTGSALRYKYLHEPVSNDDNVLQKDLLVLLPMTTPDCLDLIKIVQEGVSELNTIIHFKPHPFNDINFLSQQIDLSQHFIVDDLLGNLIFDYKVITGMTTGALLEAGLLGLKVIKIQRQLSIDFDTTFLNPELRIQVSDSKEFQKAFVRLNESNFETSFPVDTNLINGYFEPISAGGMATFLP
jgi:hypothetical protein